ncbi:hypothetical protein AWW66_22985 [Micromonospora rosaria]|uniref:Uncharacterized protein n=1 Tax=Micromonospora rosaria TaxID=47874 RepID=A0A136PMU1_9ACTN|nr:hypothetical protein AWW66_22985 [Micromonospora rosaria]
MTTGQPAAVQIELEGGPTGLPPEIRRQWVPPDLPKVKIPYNGGYEHFERLDVEESGRLVFRWTYRSRIAE